MMRPSHVSETAIMNRCTNLTGSGNFKVETMVQPLCDLLYCQKYHIDLHESAYIFDDRYTTMLI